MSQASPSAFILYTHPDCAFSAAAKMDYRKRKVDYVEIDVSKQPDKIPDLQKLTGGERLTPVMVGDLVWLFPLPSAEDRPSPS